MSAREHARRMVDAAIGAADAGEAVLRALRVEEGRLWVGEDAVALLDEVERVWLVGAGKAALPMAWAACGVLGERVAGGTLTTRDGHGGGRAPVEVWEASHPLPDARGLAGAADALACARAAGPHDLVLCLLSGGASALWPAPPAGVALEDVRALTHALLRAGASIQELNTVRRHLSRVAGGGLALAAGQARLLTLAVSDVVGDAPHVIGSGPTVPDPTTYADALEVVLRYELRDGSGAIAWLQAGAAGEVPDTAKPGDRAFADSVFRVVASNRDALRGASAEAERLGYAVEAAGEPLRGEAREAGRRIAELARGRADARGDASPPLVLLFGGETTVTVRGDGQGGRNQELALALAMEIAGDERIVAVSAGTDGSDGTTRAAGAIVDGGTTGRGEAAGASASGALERNDSHRFLSAADDLLVTGPTGTNVCDLVAVLIGGGAGTG